jgi:hypothetical protein
MGGKMKDDNSIECLFIGGPHDGERIVLPLPLPRDCTRPSARLSRDVRADLSPFGKELIISDYRLETLRAPGKDFCVYIYNPLPLTVGMELLVKNYRSPSPKQAGSMRMQPMVAAHSGAEIIDNLDRDSTLLEKLLVYFLVNNKVVDEPLGAKILGGIDALILEELIWAQQQGDLPGICNPEQIEGYVSKRKQHEEKFHGSKD